MENPHKLTSRQELNIISQKTQDYVPDPRGMGYAFYYAMLLNKNKIAQIDGDNGDTDYYGSLLRRCIRVCMRLLFKGITKVDVICQCSNNHFNSCVPIICSYFLGVKAAPLDPTLSLSQITDILEQLKPRIIFVSEDVLDLIAKVLDQLSISCEIVVYGSTEIHTSFDEFLEPVEYETEFIPLPVENLEETAIILFTGDKEVCLSHHCLMVHAVNIICCCNLGNMLYLSNFLKKRTKSGFMVTISFKSFFWLTAVHVLNSTTLSATTRVITQNFEVASVWKLIDEYNVSFLSCTTNQALLFYKNEKPEGANGKSLQLMLTTGSRFTKTDLNELRRIFPQCFITNWYGRRESGGPVTMYNFTKPEHIRHQYENPSSCGKLTPGITCKIVDPITKKILGVNEAGELCYKSNFLCTTAVLDEDGWVRTNEIAFYDERQSIHVLCSYDDVFRYKCWHIVPSVMETVIKEHPCVKDAVVIGIPHENIEIGEVPMALVNLKRRMTDKVTAEDITLFANAYLSQKQQLRGGVKIIREIPMILIRDEPDRQLLKKRVLNGDL